MEKTAAIWTAFNEQSDELERWLAAVQSKLAAAVLQNTLQQKIDQLQSTKVVVIFMSKSIFILAYRIGLEVDLQQTLSRKKERLSELSTSGNSNTHVTSSHRSFLTISSGLSLAVYIFLPYKFVGFLWQ